MHSWRESRVDESGAQELLAEYFTSRVAGFPTKLGSYRTTLPRREDFIAPVGLFLIAVRHDGTDAGCGGIRLLDYGDSDSLRYRDSLRYEVKHLYVRPVARGHGLGRALLAELESRARGFGATELVLDTHASLTAAGGLYRARGFTDIPAYNDNPNATNWYHKALRNPS